MGINMEKPFKVQASTHITNTSWIEVMLDDSGDSLRYRICWGQENPEIEESEILYMDEEDDDGDSVAYFMDSSGTIWKLNEMIRTNM
jgi:hypothetical protein